MPDELFADSVGAIAITGSVVRIDLVSLSTSDADAKGQARTVFRQRVVMPVEGFVQSFGVMARAMRQLEEKGLVRRNDQPGAPVAAEKAPGASAAPEKAPAAPAAPEKVPAAPSSPNFKPR